MIALLRGRVASSRLGVVVLDVGGVGYLVHVPPGAVGEPAGAEATLHTSLGVRDDALTLYGFVDPASRDLFETLQTVTGVGPKVALAALATLGADGLRRAVVTEDVRALTTVPGLGRRGAQRIILELRERLAAADGPVAPAGGSARTDGSAHSEARSALAALGYAPAEIVGALDALPADDDQPAEELLRRALRALAGG